MLSSRIENFIQYCAQLQKEQAIILDCGARKIAFTELPALLEIMISRGYSTQLSELIFPAYDDHKIEANEIKTIVTQIDDLFFDKPGTPPKFPRLAEVTFPDYYDDQSLDLLLKNLPQITFFKFVFSPKNPLYLDVSDSIVIQHEQHNEVSIDLAQHVTSFYSLIKVLQILSENPSCGHVVRLLYSHKDPRLKLKPKYPNPSPAVYWMHFHDFLFKAPHLRTLQLDYLDIPPAILQLFLAGRVYCEADVKALGEHTAPFEQLPFEKYELLPSLTALSLAHCNYSMHQLLDILAMLAKFTPSLKELTIRPPHPSQPPQRSAFIAAINQLLEKKELYKLDLSGMIIDNQIANGLRQIIKTRHLRQLHLNHCRVTGLIETIFPTGESLKCNLTHVYLAGSCLSIDDLRWLLKSLNPATLQFLDINGLTSSKGELVRELELFFRRISNPVITGLDLSGVGLTADDLKAIDTCFPTLPHLKQLNLSHNNLERAEVFPFKRFPELDTLLLTNTNIHWAGDNVSHFLFKNAPSSNLAHVEIGDNQRAPRVKELGDILRCFKAHRVKTLLLSFKFDLCSLNHLHSLIVSTGFTTQRGGSFLLPNIAEMNQQPTDSRTTALISQLTGLINDLICSNFQPSHPRKNQPAHETRRLSSPQHALSKTQDSSFFRCHTPHTLSFDVTSGDDSTLTTTSAFW